MLSPSSVRGDAAGRRKVLAGRRLCLFWRRTTRAGVLSGMITGTVVTIVWKLWLKAPTGIYELIPAFFLAVAAILVVSLVTAPPDDSRA